MSERSSREFDESGNQLASAGSNLADNIQQNMATSQRAVEAAGNVAGQSGAQSAGETAKQVGSGGTTAAGTEGAGAGAGASASQGGASAAANTASAAAVAGGEAAGAAAGASTGAAAGATAGSAVPGIGTLIGAAVGAAGSGLLKFFVGLFVLLALLIGSLPSAISNGTFGTDGNEVSDASAMEQSPEVVYEKKAMPVIGWYKEEFEKVDKKARGNIENLANSQDEADLGTFISDTVSEMCYQNFTSAASPRAGINDVNYILSAFSVSAANVKYLVDASFLEGKQAFLASSQSYGDWFKSTALGQTDFGGFFTNIGDSFNSWLGKGVAADAAELEKLRYSPPDGKLDSIMSGLRRMKNIFQLTQTTRTKVIDVPGKYEEYALQAVVTYTRTMEVEEKGPFGKVTKRTVVDPSSATTEWLYTKTGNTIRATDLGMSVPVYEEKQVMEGDGTGEPFYSTYYKAVDGQEQPVQDETRNVRYYVTNIGAFDKNAVDKQFNIKPNAYYMSLDQSPPRDPKRSGKKTNAEMIGFFSESMTAWLSEETIMRLFGFMVGEGMPGGNFPLHNHSVHNCGFGDSFGASRDGGRRGHSGVDIGSAPGDPIFAMASGIVTENRWNGAANAGGTGGGWQISFTDSAGYTYKYLHMQSQSTVPVGTQVVAGQTIVGYVGNTGQNITAYHLHVSITDPSGTYINPYPILRAAHDAPNMTVGAGGGSVIGGGGYGQTSTPGTAGAFLWNVKVTSYCYACNSPKYSDAVATGGHAIAGVTAAAALPGNAGYLPLGTNVVINGTQFTVHDYYGASGLRLDIYVPTGADGQCACNSSPWNMASVPMYMAQ